jgi:hypothetical protein
MTKSVRLTAWQYHAIELALTAYRESDQRKVSIDNESLDRLIDMIGNGVELRLVNERPDITLRVVNGVVTANGKRVPGVVKIG